jgi:hypothetical protein
MSDNVNGDAERNLEADLRLCEAASPGPWFWLQDEGGPDRVFLEHTCDFPGSLHEGLGHSPEECGFTVLECFDVEELDDEERPHRADNRPSPEDAAMIAAARDGWPAAIRRAIAAERRVAELEAELSRLRGPG